MKQNSCLGAKPTVTKKSGHEEDEGRPTEEPRGDPRNTEAKGKGGPNPKQPVSARQREARENKETTLPVWLFIKQDSLGST